MACSNFPTSGDIVTIRDPRPKADLSIAFPSGEAIITRVDGRIRIDAYTGYTTTLDEDGRAVANGLHQYRHSHKVWKDGKLDFYRDEAGIIHYDSKKK